MHTKSDSAWRGAELLFGYRKGIRVVLHDDGKAKRLAQTGAGVGAGPAGEVVRCVDNLARSGINPAGGGKTYGFGPTARA